MKLIMTLLVRDEEDILRTNILYHLEQGVDFFIVTDHQSTDGTPEVLREFEARGVLLSIRQTADTYMQSDWVTHMARLAKTRFSADWVIDSDADEFWWPLEGSLRSTLQAIPEPYAVVGAPRHNFVPVRGDGLPKNPATMVIRQARSRNSLGQPLPEKVCHRGMADVRVHEGNHRVSANEPLAVYAGRPIEIFHYPIRTYAQLENKIAKGGAAYERSSLDKEIGATWRELYSQWQHGKLMEYFERETQTPEQAARGIENGELVPDGRLSQYLKIRGILPMKEPAG